MSSRDSTTAHPAAEAGQGDALLPPPPLRGLLVPQSPRRLDHVAQLPALTTTIAPKISSGYKSNPSSTTSLSSPFSQNNHSPFVGSASGATRGASPMASRLSPNYSAPYNPQEWAPVSAGAPRSESGQSSRGQRLRNVVQVLGRPRPDGTLASPPPPYSPRPRLDGSHMSSSSTLSPEDIAYTNTTSVQQSTPTSSTIILPVVPATGRYVRARPVSMIQMGDHNAGRGPNFFAPPPAAPQTSHGSKALSKLGLDKLRPSSPLFSSFTNSSKRTSAAHQTAIGETSHLQCQITVPSFADNPAGKPPASRRAISADAIPSGSDTSRAESASNSRDSSRKPSWERGMVLPGPPPGLPPSASRSHSVNDIADVSTDNLLPPATRHRNRQAPSLGTSLGPVPPTPADWADSTAPAKPGPLHIDTSNTTPKSSSPDLVEWNPGPSSRVPITESASSVGLFRSAAVRDSPAKGLRERRAVSRGSIDWPMETPDGDSSISNNPWADALHVNLPVESTVTVVEGVNRNRLVGSSPTSDAGIDPTIPPDRYSASAGAEATTRTSPAKPRKESLRLNVSRLAQTPPFSTGSGPSSPASPATHSRFTTRKLPTPPYNASQKPDASRYRPISHILHTPTNEQGLPEPLVPLQIAKPRTSFEADLPSADLEQLLTESLARHRAFFEKEQLASNDNERLQLFSEYIVAESRIRRARYSKAWTSGGFDVRSVKDQLFELAVPSAGRSSSVSESSAGLSTEPPTPESSASAQGRPESAWWANYQPALSPIASMSNDEMSSRGRTSSRWWESHTGSDGEGVARKIERSKRESKYMGFQRETIHTGIPEIDIPDDQLGEIDGDNEHPAEKADPDAYGFYDEVRYTSPQLQQSKQPESPSKLDVSRFVTLPPPYPRHYPAVNNSHPALVSYRTAVRAYSDLSEVTARKSRFALSSEALGKDTQQRLTENRRRFRANIQTQIEEGSISYAEAAEAEEALKLGEHEIEKQAVQTEYDSFQDVVLNPLHDLLNERVASICRCISELQEMLFSDAQTPNLDQTQEEGDEEPELLEKLTQLKWLFEAREQVHKELYDLLTQRNEKYKAIVLLPYQQAENLEKIKNTKLFFAQDNHDREVAYYSECLKRHEDFLEIIESNVSRGIELQSSTFWDIAPGILDLLQKIPTDLSQPDFEGIQIPDIEYTENPTYAIHPFQYLYSLLSHAEKSTYQFIEAQINLHCLLHEAKTQRGAAMWKAQLSKNEYEGSGRESVHEGRDVRAEEEANLTAELRQKTAMIEEQWAESLGNQIMEMKERVRKRLVAEGGWDEIVQSEN